MARLALAALIVLLLLLAPGAAYGGVGVNVSPGWGDTVDGRNVPQMWNEIGILKPHSIRQPFVRYAGNHGSIDAWREAARRGIDTVMIDNTTYPVEDVVADIAAIHAEGLPVYLEGQNEPDGVAAPWLANPVPDSEWQPPVRERQERLYALVNHRFPVVCPAMDRRYWQFQLSLPCDILNTHLYTGNSATSPPTAEDMAIPPTDGRPVWVTEIGHKTYKEYPCGFWCWVFKQWRWVVSEEQQRDWLVQEKAMLEANGVRRVFVYKLTDDGNDQFQQQLNWGLFRYNGWAKLAVNALKGP